MFFVTEPAQAVQLQLGRQAQNLILIHGALEGKQMQLQVGFQPEYTLLH
jgi:hypothetical protein